jgi:hypothetical protein
VASVVSAECRVQLWSLVFFDLVFFGLGLWSLVETGDGDERERGARVLVLSVFRRVVVVVGSAMCNVQCAMCNGRALAAGSW